MATRRRRRTSTPGRRRRLPAAVSVIHHVSQRMDLDLSGFSAEDAKSAVRLHKHPDIGVVDSSFPGKMSWSVVRSSSKRAPGRKRLLLLERDILFTFKWSNRRAMSAWARQAIEPQDALLPSYVAGGYEGIFVNDQMFDYETRYRCLCP